MLAFWLSLSDPVHHGVLVAPVAGVFDRQVQCYKGVLQPSGTLSKGAPLQTHLTIPPSCFGVNRSLMSPLLPSITPSRETEILTPSSASCAFAERNFEKSNSLDEFSDDSTTLFISIIFSSSCCPGVNTCMFRPLNAITPKVPTSTSKSPMAILDNFIGGDMFDPFDD